MPVGMLSVPLPSWLEQLGRRMAFEDGIFDGELPNHVLVNEYSLPNGGIMVCNHNKNSWNITHPFRS